MKLISFKHLVIGVCMFAAAGMALALKPTEKVADAGPKIDLEVLIPKTFGDWKVDETITPLIANPEEEALINKIYNQTLTRTYVNSQNERIMLSIAYGGDQSDSMAVHKPEVCYPGQGFQIVKNVTDAAPDVDYPVFVTGERRAPPEDVGGPPGFMEFVEAISMRSHPQHKHMLRWYGGPFNAMDFGEAGMHLYIILAIRIHYFV